MLGSVAEASSNSPMKSILGSQSTRPGSVLLRVIRNAQRLSLRALSRESSRLAKACRERGITGDDLSGGTFTVWWFDGHRDLQSGSRRFRGGWPRDRSHCYEDRAWGREPSSTFRTFVFPDVQPKGSTERAGAFPKDPRGNLGAYPPFFGRVAESVRKSLPVPLGRALKAKE